MGDPFMVEQHSVLELFSQPYRGKAFSPLPQTLLTSPSNITTVRVLDGVTPGMSNVYRPLVQVKGCERLEVFMWFSPSVLFAKLKKCMLENLFSPNSRT
jgi:hypothetical protein